MYKYNYGLYTAIFRSESFAYLPVPLKLNLLYTAGREDTLLAFLCCCIACTRTLPHIKVYGQPSVSSCATYYVNSNEIKNEAMSKKQASGMQARHPAHTKLCHTSR